MIRIVIAEDQRMLRNALGTLLSFEDDFEIVGEAKSGDVVMQLIALHKPDICLLDIEMPGKSGLEVADEMKRSGSNCKVIILTTFARPGYFERAIKAGVYGYLLKDGSIDELAESIRRVMQGKREYSPELIVNSFAEDNPLTGREQEILKLAAEGKTSREISNILFLSSGTVRNYLSEIFQKLDVKNKIEAIQKAKEKGWL